MFSQHRRKAKVLFVASDILLTALAFQAAYLTRLWLPFERLFFFTLPVKALLLGFAVLVWVLTGLWMQLYERLDSGHPKVILRDTLRQCALSTALVVLFQYALRLDVSRPFLALLGGYSWFFLSLFRLNAGNLVGLIRKGFGVTRNVLIVGTNERARRLAESLTFSREYGVAVTGFAETEPEQETLNGYPVHRLADLPVLLRRQVIDEIIFAVPGDKLKDLEEVFLLCDEEGVRTHLAVDFFPHVNSEIYLDRLGATPLLTFAAAPQDEVRLLVKRLTDVALSAAALLLLLPFMFLIAVLIRLTSPGPAIFRQERCGLNGRVFTFYKFRSMVDGAEQLQESLSHLNQKTTAFKIPNDPRVTPLGRWLRKFSIDEWPQLWNVLKGDMSLVGPRPAVPQEVERYERWQRRRLRMRPGLTCLWAVAGRDALDFDTWMRMDMQYIDSWSLGLDWRIMIQTLPRVLLGKGAN